MVDIQFNKKLLEYFSRKIEMTYKDVMFSSDIFLKYEHPFDFVIDTIKEIRRCKATFNMSSKRIDRAYVHVKNDELKFGLLLESGFYIARSCQVNQLHICYFDDTNESNNIHVSFGEKDSFTIYMQDHMDTDDAIRNPYQPAH